MDAEPFVEIVIEQVEFPIAAHRINGRFLFAFGRFDTLAHDGADRNIDDGAFLGVEQARLFRRFRPPIGCRQQVGRGAEAAACAFYLQFPAV